MRVVLQKVSNAQVSINQLQIKRSINDGYVLLTGFEDDDTDEDIKWVINKIINLRIFPDESQKMNLSINDVGGEILIISQFTLFANIKKGNRPSFIKAGKPNNSILLYNRTINYLKTVFSNKIETGEFGADMNVSLTNKGPVTIIIDSKNKEY